MKRTARGLNLKRVFTLKLIAFAAVASVITAVVVASKNGKHAMTTRSAVAERALKTANDSTSASIGRSQPLSLLVPSITATLADDILLTAKKNPGDTINYTAIITNNGVNSPADDALNVVFNNTLDPNTTLVGSSIHASPIAANNAYATVGNTLLEVGVAASGNPAVTASGSLFDNDTIATAPDTIQLQSFQSSSVNGGTVSVDAAGHFSYLPPVGFTGTDTFTYTIRNSADNTLQDTGTVTVTVNGPRVWYVNNSGANGDGRSSSPFNTLTPVNGAGGAGDADAAGDIIYLFTGSGAYTTGLVMENNERLIGNGVALVVNTITLRGAGTRPTISTAQIALASGNTLSGLNLSNNGAGAAIFGTSVGTLTIDNMLINTTGGGLDLTGVSTPSVSISLDSVTSSGGTKNINLVGLNGTISLGSGGLSGATGNSFDVSGGAAAISYSGNITNSGAKQVNIASMTGGSATFDGAVNGTGTGINLVTNGTATITFRGGVVLSTGANAAFSATGGGTVNVCDESPCVPASTGALVNTLTTTTGTALNVVNTTIGGNKLEFRSISANGGTNGIILNNTGAGGLTVTGTGTTDGSGGTIQNISTRGASFISANNISLSNMTFTLVGTTNGADPTVATSGCGDLVSGNNLSCNAGIHLQSVTSATFTNVDMNNNSGGNSSGQIGINGDNVTNFVLANSNVLNFGNETREDGLKFHNMLGTSAITGTTISGNETVQVHVENDTGTLTKLDVSNTIISTSAAPNGNHGILFDTHGAATGKLQVQGTTFLNLFSNCIDALGDGATGGLSVVVEGSTGSPKNSFTGCGASAITIAQNGAAPVSFNIANNGSPASPTFLGGTSSHAININQAGNAPQTAVMQGAITNNFIGNNSSSTSSTIGGSGIQVATIAPGTLTVLISGNTTQGTGANGINVQMGEDTNVNHKLNATILNNSATVTDINSFDGIRVVSGTLTNDAGTTCAEISGNNGSATAAGNDFTVRQRFATTFQLRGYTGGSTDTAAVQTHLDVNQANNPLGAGNDWFITTQAPGGGFVNSPGGAQCTQPTTPILSQLDPTNPFRDYSRVEVGANRMSQVMQQRSEASNNPSISASVGQLTIPPAVWSETTNSTGAVSRSTALIIPIKTASIRSASNKSGDVRLNHAVKQQKRKPLSPLSGETINVPIGTLAAGKSITIKYSATVSNTPAAASVSTQGTVSGSNFSSVLTNDPETAAPNDATVTNLAVPDLIAVKTNDVSGSAQLGTPTWTWTTTITNSGTATATFAAGATVFRDNLPNSNITYGTPNISVPAANATCTVDGNNDLVCLAGASGLSIAPAGSVTVTVTATASAVGAYLNPRGGGICQVDPEPPVNGTVFESNEANNTCTNTVKVFSPPTVTKAFGGPGINTGGTTTMTFTFTNPAGNPADLTGVGFTAADTLTSGLQIAATPNLSVTNCGSPTTTGFTAGSTSVNITGATVTTANPCVVSVNVTATTAGTVNNSVTVTSTEGGQGNTSSTSLSVAAAPTLSKAFASASARTVIGLTNTNALVRFTADAPGALLSLTAIAGLVAGDTVVGIDFRPATGVLYALGVNGATAHLYTINTASGAATQVGGNIVLPQSAGVAGAETDFGFDFNPVVDRIRVVANNRDNFRLNPITGAVAGADTALNPGTPVAAGAAYTNNLGGATSTTLYVIDASTDQLNIQGGNPVPPGGSPNGGTLTLVGNLGVNTSNEVGFDIASGSGTAYAALQVGATSGLYTINLGTGAATLVGSIGLGQVLRDISVAPVQIPLSGSATLNFTISNPNASLTLNNVSFSDALPAGLEVDATPAASTSCGVTFNPAATDTTVSLSGITLAGGTSCTASVQVKATSAGLKTNTSGAISSTETGAGGTASDNLNVVAPPTIAKAFGAGSIALNGVTTVNFTITNPAGNPLTLTGVGFGDTLQSGLQVAAPLSGIASNCGAPTLPASPGATAIAISNISVAVGTPCTIAINVTGTTAGTVNNTTDPVTSTEGGTGVASNTAQLIVLAPPSVAKAFGAGSVPINGTTTMTFTLTNPAGNTANLTGVGFTAADTLTSGLQIAATPNLSVTNCGSPTTTGFTAGSTSVNVTGATVTTANPCVVSVNVTASQAGTVNNSVTVTSGNGGQGNTANASLGVTSADLTITKTHVGKFIQGQTGATYTLTVSNLGPGDTFGTVSVSDSLPAGLTATAMTGTNWNCTQPAGPCTRSDVLTAGNSYPAITLTVDVATNAAASVTNSATVSAAADINAGNNMANDPTTVVSPASAAWDSASSVIAVDEDSVGLVALNNATVGFIPASPSTGTITGRYNITALRGISTFCPAQSAVIRVRFRDDDGSGTNAQVFFEIRRTNIAIGGNTVLYTFDSNTSGQPADTAFHTVTATPNIDFDFTNNVYWIEVKIIRSNAGVLPSLGPVQIYESSGPVCP